MRISRNYFPLGVSRLDAISCAYNALAMAASITRERLRANLRRLIKSHPTVRSQTALAEQTGLGVSTINGLFTAKRGTALENIDLLARTFGVDVTELFAQPDAVQLRQTPYIQVGSAGGLNASSRPLVRAIRAIRTHAGLQPDEIDELIASLVERGETYETPAPKPSSDRSARPPGRRDRKP